MDFGRMILEPYFFREFFKRKIFGVFFPIVACTLRGGFLPMLTARRGVKPPLIVVDLSCVFHASNRTVLNVLPRETRARNHRA